VSRSLVLAFMIALLAHLLLAGMELDFFKAPFRGDRMPKTLTVDLIRPVKKKRASKASNSPTRVKKANKTVIRKDSITKKPKPKPQPTAANKIEPIEIQKDQVLPEEEPPKKAEEPPPYLPSEIPWETKEEATPEAKHAFVPNMADIPLAKPKAGDAAQSEDEDPIPSGSAEEPIIFATPDYKQNNPPTYPLLAKRRRYEGTVMLDVLVSRSGMVDSIKLAQSSGHQILDRAAIKAVGNWSFHPGKKGGEAQEMWVTIPIRFQLQ